MRYTNDALMTHGAMPTSHARASYLDDLGKGVRDGGVGELCRQRLERFRVRHWWYAQAKSQETQGVRPGHQEHDWHG